MWQVNILWQQLFFCLDTPSLIPCSCPHCHWPRIKETYLQPSFIALLYHHVVMDLRGVGISHLLSSWRFVEQPLLLCWWLPPPSCGSLSLAWVRAECKDVEVFMAFKTKPFLTYSAGRWLYCLAFGYREKNHKQTAFHISVLSCQHRTVLTNLIHNTTLVTELCLRHCTGLHVYVLQSMYLSFGLLKNALILM